MGGHPWRPNSPLVHTFRSARLHGFSWLFIVYKGDAIHTWGSKRVKVTSGGQIYGTSRSKMGNDTGELRELRYETIAPDIFAPLFGLKTKLIYKVIVNCTRMLDPECEVRAEKPHPLLGYPETDHRFTGQDPPSTYEKVKRIPADLGCKLDWKNEELHSKSWFSQDANALNEYRFELTEYQRREFVKYVLCNLGFVKSHLPIDVREQHLYAHTFSRRNW